MWLESSEKLTACSLQTFKKKEGLPRWWLVVKNPSAMRETWAQSLGWEDPLEKGKATHFSILARRIPGTALSMESQRVRHD